jgi:acetylornithine deacetylase/succinyl-diaminopimelate desuccinylase-like protein
VLSGFGSPEDNIHSPNERMRLRNLQWAIDSGREIFRSMSGSLR